MGKTRKKIKGGAEFVNSHSNNGRGAESVNSPLTNNGTGRGIELTNEYLYKMILDMQEQIDPLKILKYEMKIVNSDMMTVKSDIKKLGEKGIISDYHIRKLKGETNPIFDRHAEKLIREQRETAERLIREREHYARKFRRDGES
jgi:hypothetical protein